ncbi:hypothetical protein [Micromonospora sp. NPDC023633]|uniref:hypothetical protein n=1 Tax=Micromonospora sp. NPDC023633 TaxID=3154320 RepID=UPI0033C852B7
MTFLSVDAGPLRPSRRWYAVAAVTLLLALVTGAGLAFLPGRLGGSVGQGVPAGRSVPVRFAAGEEADRMVWITGAGPTVPAVTCEPSALDVRELEEWHSVSTTGDEIVRSAGGRQWRGVLVIRAEPPGRYAVRCDVVPAQPGLELSIGGPPWLFGVKARALTQLGAVGLGMTGTVGGGALAIIVAARRSAHRRRLSLLP